VVARQLTLLSVPPAVFSNEVVLYLSPSEGLSLIQLSRGFAQALRLDAVAQSAWNADDVSETFHLVVPPMNAYFGSYIDAWQDMEFRILLTSVSRIFGAPVHEAKPQDLSVTFSSSAPALGPDGKPESQVYSVEHTDRGTGAKSVRSSSPAGAEPEISLLNFDEASGLRVCYVHLFNHTGVPMGPANSRAPE